MHQGNSHMALLKETATGKIIPLHSHHTFGRRAESVDTLIPRDDVSKIHAVIAWTGDEWLIRCLATNGTWLDRSQLPADTPTPIKEGQTIGFSGPENASFIIESLDEPKDLLLPVSQHSDAIVLEDYHLLPDENLASAACFYCNISNGWVLDVKRDDEHEKIALKHQEDVTVGNHHWQLFLADKLSPTKLLNTVNNTVDDFTWVFDVSANEENVELRLQKGKKVIELGERSHYYLLMQLARHKHEHLEQGATNEAAGWVSKGLLEMELGLNESHLNIQLHRACKQLAEYFSFTPEKPDTLLRKRGQLKLCCNHFIIRKGGQITHSLNAD